MDYYEHLDELPATVLDAEQMERVLETHFDDSANFEVTLSISEKANPITTEKFLTEFSSFMSAASRDDDLVFYFSGHGEAGEWGMHLYTSEHTGGQGVGIPFEMLMYRAGREDFNSLTCILDCCFSGSASTTFSAAMDLSLVRRNVTILASSTGKSYFDDDFSDYTREVIKGFDGSATDPCGHVTPFELHRWTTTRLRNSRNGSPVLKSNSSEAIDLRSPRAH